MVYPSSRNLIEFLTPVKRRRKRSKPIQIPYNIKPNQREERHGKQSRAGAEQS